MTYKKNNGVAQDGGAIGRENGEKEDGDSASGSDSSCESAGNANMHPLTREAEELLANGCQVRSPEKY